jgi:hypothetical protein
MTVTPDTPSLCFVTSLVELGSHDSGRLLVARRPTLAWLPGAILPRLEIYAWRPRNSDLLLRRVRFYPWSMERTGRPQARHDDSHQPGDHSRVWDIACRDIGRLRDRRLVGTLLSHCPCFWATGWKCELFRRLVGH